jgi:hypothetical protein
LSGYAALEETSFLEAEIGIVHSTATDIFEDVDVCCRREDVIALVEIDLASIVVAGVAAGSAGGRTTTKRKMKESSRSVTVPGLSSYDLTGVTALVSGRAVSAAAVAAGVV